MGALRGEHTRAVTGMTQAGLYGTSLVLPPRRAGPRGGAEMPKSWRERGSRPTVKARKTTGWTGLVPVLLSAGEKRHTGKSSPGIAEFLLSSVSGKN